MCVNSILNQLNQQQNQGRQRKPSVKTLRSPLSKLNTYIYKCWYWQYRSVCFFIFNLKRYIQKSRATARHSFHKTWTPRTERATYNACTEKCFNCESLLPNLHSQFLPCTTFFFVCKLHRFVQRYFLLSKLFMEYGLYFKLAFTRGCSHLVIYRFSIDAHFYTLTQGRPQVIPYLNIIYF